ncbi:uncharacterized protein BX664DRAFT_344311 [Halteromyces radiatus]|uniref:uncharacterized protein n=1 Tax=Halteromyces radiatus TaxID=101107 RepID=UPI002221149D|nr:uncharacterized protein BX664DRAFT_344311 [Halteromyces radiatus]KAI8076306.1 hypothetical protein BX664DRAFT_344311 [Halteromyces radiatus]
MCYLWSTITFTLFILFSSNNYSILVIRQMRKTDGKYRKVNGGVCLCEQGLLGCQELLFNSRSRHTSGVDHMLGGGWQLLITSKWHH